MLRSIAIIVMLGALGSAKADCGAAKSEPIDVAVTCVPSSRKLIYRCDVRLSHAKTGFPLCIHGGTIQFDMPSMPMAHQVPKIDLNTDANGEMKNVEVRLEMQGEWRALFSARDLSVVKRLNFQSGNVTNR